MVTNLVPAGAVLWGWLDGEKVTSRQMLALSIILPMVVLVQIGGRQQQGATDIRLVPRDVSETRES
jgi:MFS-type transporter involved in bile tolerance (Atg22 family)